MSAPDLPAKRDVQRAFAHAARTYDANAFLQREIANRLLERLDYIKLQPARIVDLGSGTGYLTRKLRERFAGAAITSIDLAFDMLQYARGQLPRKPILARLLRHSPVENFVCANAESLPLANEKVDAIISNLTLQWCDVELVAKEIVRTLKPNGLFMFTTFGPDTLKELRTAFRMIDDKPHVNTFVDMHDIGDMLVAAGFADPVMDQEMITLTYSDLKSMLREMKGIGAHNVLPGRATGLMGKSQWQRLVNAYETYRRDNRLPSTWEVVYGHAWKPKFAKQTSIDGTQTINLNDFTRMVRKSTDKAGGLW
jgi:malonyl-CoA O-methyltransferase